MSKPNLTLATANLIRLEAYADLRPAPATAAANLAATQAKGSAKGGDLAANEWEVARRERAERLKLPATYLQPVDTSASDIHSDTDCLRTDGELAKMCAIGFKQYAQFKYWLVTHDMSRAGQQGFTFDELLQKLQQLGVKGCEVYTRRVIRKGIGFYWNYDPATDKIYPVSYTALVARSIQYAYDLGLHDLYLHGNHPGQRRDMYLSVAGSGADFEANVLATWYASHGNPTLSRFTLSALLARDVRSIRRMEKRVGIRIAFNEAQTTDPAAVPLKADGTPRGDVRYEQGVWTSRLPNTYITAHAVRQHPHRGQGRKAAHWFKQWFAETRLPDYQGEVSSDAHGKLNRVTRTYCESTQALKTSRKRGCKQSLYVATLRRHKGRVWEVDALYPDI